MRAFCCPSPAPDSGFFFVQNMTQSKNSANSYRLAREAYAFISSEKRSPLIDRLRIWLNGKVNPFTLADASECLNLRSELGKRGVQSRIGRALKELGCERFELKTPNARHWYAPPTPREIISEEEE